MLRHQFTEISRCCRHADIKWGKTGTKSLEIIPGIPAGGADIFAHISPESKHHVNDDWRAHGEDGGIHKILAYFTGGNPHPVANCGAYAKSVPFHEVLQAVHTSKLLKTGIPGNFGARFFEF